MPDSTDTTVVDPGDSHKRATPSLTGNRAGHSVHLDTSTPQSYTTTTPSRPATPPPTPTLTTPAMRHLQDGGDIVQAQVQTTSNSMDKHVDLTMGDIAMLSTARPAASAIQRDVLDFTPGMVYPHSSSFGTYDTPREGPSSSSSSSIRRNLTPSSSGAPSTANTPLAAKNTMEVPVPPSTSSASSTSTRQAAPSTTTTNTTTTSLTPSRNTLHPLPPLNTDPSVLPPLPRLPVASGTAPPTTTATSPPSVSTHPIPGAGASSSIATPLPSHGSTASLPSSSSATTATGPPSHVHSDGRYKRYTETQGDYKPGGYARIKEGDRLNRGRYEVVKKLGVGHFSVVWLAWDREEGGYVAIKVVRSSRRYARAAAHEDKLLTVIQGPRDERKSYIVSFLDSFEERAWEGPESHVCLVFELMGMSLTDVLRKNDFDGLPIKTTKLITKQVLTGLSYLHSLGIAHTDIKPDNILLYHSPRAMSKMLKAQFEADEVEKERQAREEALNPKPEPINWLEHKPKIPGLNPQQIREIQLARIRSEQRKWVITPSHPLESPIPFANGKKIVKEFVLANKHLYKRFPAQHHSSASVKAIEGSASQSARNSSEIDRTSAAHPTSTEGSLKPENAQRKDVNSAQTTPTKDVTTNVASSQSSASPKGKLTDTTSTAESSSYTASSSAQSSKSPYSSLGRLRPGSHTSIKDLASYMAPTRKLDRLSMHEFAKFQYHADNLDIGRDSLTGNGNPFGLKHPRTSSNGSSAQGETDFDKLLRQPMEYDIINAGMGAGYGPSAMFMQKSPSDSGGSEIFSPASTTMTRYFGTNGSGASATDSPASMASTPIGSSPEMHIARKLASPIFPHPGAIYSTGVPIPRAKALTRTGSTASIFASPSFASFSPADHSGSVYQTDYASGRPTISRAKSTYDLEDEQAMMSLPASPPSHPTSYVSLASMSPEVRMRKGSSAILSGLARSGSDASIGGFDFSITEEREPSSSTDFASRYGGDEGNRTISSKVSTLPGNHGSLHGLGLSMSASLAHLKGLEIPRSRSAITHSSDVMSPLVSASPPNSMTSSMLSRASDVSSQSPPISMGSVEPPKTIKLDSPARVKSDPLLNVHVKISDLGNAIYYNELKGRGALPENVCTRQYRPPENIIQAEYNLGVDVWALGCVIYEMITGEMLFNPGQEKYRYTKEDDLLGQQIEILGPFSPEFALSGKKSLHFFNRHGSILRVRLTPWLLFDVMVKKYYMPRAKARKFCDFLLRMLEPDPSKRATVEELLQDPWLNEIEEDDDMVLYRERKKHPAPNTAGV